MLIAKPKSAQTKPSVPYLRARTLALCWIIGWGEAQQPGYAERKAIGEAAGNVMDDGLRIMFFGKRVRVGLENCI
ncbi:hypothetical protein FHS52_001349 [Erythromicrobium ramosum]|uniref:Uncharacterized protein n=1 Tax=Erythrobacter ramosus TaxID=35811 RepID=A0ABR6HXJ1_9SPHN|nr:hypothetical protein [Erythrobacter ramosus]MBB3775380.1 hypothetical protein [Erythrobacter ramosus]